MVQQFTVQIAEYATRFYVLSKATSYSRCTRPLVTFSIPPGEVALHPASSRWKLAKAMPSSS